MKNSFVKRIIKYSICYLIIVVFIALFFYLYNKSFVWINVSYDGLDQHLVNLQLLKNLLHGNFNIFFWNVGYGMDMYANFAYYILGDFPSFLVVLFKDSDLSIAYEVIALLRIYLAGLTFVIYCNDKKYQDNNVVIGALLYSFSLFSFFAMARHPFFLNSMFIFPILLLSVEKLVLNDKKIFFIIMIFILFVSSFYFGYMLSVIAMIYGIILAYKSYSNKKDIWKKVGMAIFYAIVGIMMASVVLIPTFEAFINSPRTGGNLYFYSLDYYPKLLASFISTDNPGNWSFIGISSIVLVTLPLFIKDKKKNSIWYCFLIILFIPLLIPFIATIFDCMSFPNNRWIYVMAFVLTIITLEVLEKENKINVRETILFIVFFGLTIFILRLKISFQEVIALILALIFAYSLLNKKRYLLSIVVISILCNFYFMYDSHFGGYINEFVEREATELWKNNNEKVPYLSDAIDYIKDYDKGFYNIMIYPHILNNLGLANDYNSTSYFYSIVSKNYYHLAKELENSEMTMNTEIKNFNYRTKINGLLNNKYLVTTNKDYHPYGYEVIKNFNNSTYILENKLGSSFVHLYTKSISMDDYQKLSPILKEDALLNYSIEDKSAKVDLNSIQYIPYKSNISFDNKVIKKENKEELVLKFDNVYNSEVYLSIKNLQYKNDFLIEILGRNDFRVDACLNDLCFSEEEGNKFLTPYYIENNDILINFGYYDNINGEVRISFNNNGTYSFDNIELLAINFDDYEKTLNNLNVPLDNINVFDNHLSFDAYIKDSGTLSFATNYSKYFDIYIDNVKVDSKVVNQYFLGCDVNAGNHHIEIIYQNRLILKSFYVSILGVLLFSGIIIIDKKRKGVSYEKN